MAERNARRTGDRSVVAPHRPADTAARGHGAMAADPVADHASAIGNLEMLRRLDAAGVRPKLDVSSPGDAHEVEADRVAEQVMSMPADRAEASPTDEEEEPVATKLDVARAEATPTDEEEQVATRLDRAVEPAKDEEEPVATRLDRAVEPTKDEEETVATKLEVARAEATPADEEEQVATRLDRAVEPATDEEEQVATTADATPAMTPAVEADISRTRAGGTPLDTGARRFFEPRFGRELSDTKIHTDAHAARLASSLNAQAFTVGRDIYLAAGKYQPGTESGRSLLAHELTHTVQQQPGAKLERASGDVASSPNPAHAPRSVQRADDDDGGEPASGGGGGGGGGAGGATASPAPSAADAGVVDETALTITYPELKLADFKAQTHRGAKYAAQQIKRAKNFARGDPDQATVWDNSVTDATLDTKLQTRLASTLASSDPGKTYALKHPTSSYYLIGTLPQMIQTAKRPIWDRSGNPRPKDVDHIVELQISGWPGAAWANQAGASGNMELLDSKANQDSGRRIMREVQRLAKASRDFYWRRPSDPAGPAPGTDANFWQVSKKPTIAAVKERYDLVFSKAQAGLGQAGEPGNYWQWSEIAEDTKHLDDFVAATDLPAMGDWSIFPDPSGGIPKSVHHTGGADVVPKPSDVQGWFEPFRVRRLNLADPATLSADATTSPGSITLGLPSGDTRSPFGFDLDQPIALKRYPGWPNAAYLDADGLSAVWRALHIKHLSPIEISQWTVVPGRGVRARGAILPSLPIFEDLAIDLVIDGDDVYISKLFDIGEFKLPGPIQVTQSSVELTVGTNGLGVRGDVGVAINRVGEGTIAARIDTSHGFALQGTFTFDPELFDPPSRIEMGYEDGAFSGHGVLTIGEDRVRGIKTATITVDYAQGILAASGAAELEVPGLQRGTMQLTYSEEDGFSITGTFDLSPDVPGIRSGQVSATVSKGEEEGAGWKVSARGTAVPSIPGVDTQIIVTYDDGIFTAEGAAEYRRGMLSGSLRIGATNRPVDESGNPGEGATPNLRAFGSGQLTLTLAPWLAATAGVRLLPNGEIEVMGRIGLPSSLEVFPAKRFDRNLLTVNVDIPIVGVSVLGQRIGIFATIGGGLDLTAGFGPGQLRDLHLEVTYNPDHEADTLVSGAAEFYVPADAGLRLNIHGALGAGIPVVSASAGLEIGGKLGIAGAATAAVQVSWTPRQGLDLTAEAYIYAEPTFTFDITGYVLVEANLLLRTIELYSKRWRLAQLEYGAGLRLGARFPIHYREGQPFDISLDDIQIEKPDIDPMQLLTGLIHEIA